MKTYVHAQLRPASVDLIEEVTDTEHFHHCPDDKELHGKSMTAEEVITCNCNVMADAVSRIGLAPDSSIVSSHPYEGHLGITTQGIAHRQYRGTSSSMIEQVGEVLRTHKSDNGLPIWNHAWRYDPISARGDATAIINPASVNMRINENSRYRIDAPFHTDPMNLDVADDQDLWERRGIPTDEAAYACSYDGAELVNKEQGRLDYDCDSMQIAMEIAAQLSSIRSENEDQMWDVFVHDANFPNRPDDIENHMQNRRRMMHIRFHQMVQARAAA